MPSRKSLSTTKLKPRRSTMKLLTNIKVRFSTSSLMSWRDKESKSGSTSSLTKLEKTTRSISLSSEETRTRKASLKDKTLILISLKASKMIKVSNGLKMMILPLMLSTCWMSTMKESIFLKDSVSDQDLQEILSTQQTWTSNRSKIMKKRWSSERSPSSSLKESSLQPWKILMIQESSVMKLKLNWSSWRLITSKRN